jgi:uncharacterized protein (DUF2267 family)
MAATGLEVFDKSIQTTNIWLDEIMADLGPDRKLAYRALRAVLHALRDRLTVEEAAHLGAQLPLVVRGIFFDMWRPAGKPDRIRSEAEFFDRVAAELGDLRPVNIPDAVRSVMQTLDLHVTEGEIDEVKGQLPEAIRRIWPEKIAETRAHAGDKPAGKH